MTVPVKINRKLPAKLAPVKFKHFYQFVRDADELVEHYDWLRDVERSVGAAIPKIEEAEAVPRMHRQDLIKDCQESLRRYDRAGDDDPRYDDDGDLKFDYVESRIALMLAGWSNANFADQKAAEFFVRTMVEHVLAREPTACELESCCRRLIDKGMPFIPQTPEVIKVLKREQKVWRRRKWAISRTELLYREIVEELIPKAKAKLEKAQAEAEAKAAQRKLEVEAEAARKKAEAEAEAERQRLEEEVRALQRPQETLANAYRNGRSRGRFAGRPGGPSVAIVLEEALATYRGSWFNPEDCFMSYAMGYFEARREQCLWRRIEE
jgi:hypothetical protein